MFRLATNADLIDLKMLEPRDIYPPDKALEWKWGLKSFGYMLVLREALKLTYGSTDRPSILEAGVGLGNVLYEKVKDFADFIGVDKAGFYDKDGFDHARRRCPEMRFIDGFIGEFNEAIPNESIDLTCSVSVLEHVPQNDIAAVVSDLTRVTKHGGRFVHTLDVHRENKAIWQTYEKALIDNGFEFDEPPEQIDFTKDGILYEPLSIVFRAYEKGPEYERKRQAVRRNYGTIAILATYPGNTSIIK